MPTLVALATFCGIRQLCSFDCTIEGNCEVDAFLVEEGDGMVGVFTNEDVSMSISWLTSTEMPMDGMSVWMDFNLG